MKKRIFTLMIGAIAALSSCSKTDDAPTASQSGEELATFNIEAPVATRNTAIGLTRYIIEAYEGKNLNTTPQRVEAAIGSLTLTLKKNTDYTFVFWADKGIAKSEGVASSGYWNTEDLRAVTVSTGKESTVGEAAYCLAVSFNSKDFDLKKTVTLKNATAQVNFVEAAGLMATDNSLKVKYSISGKLDVATGKITEVIGEVNHTFSAIEQTAKDGNVATDYILAPFDEKRLVDLTVTLNEEPAKLITGVPFQQNYKTNIKGEYSNIYVSTFTVSSEVEDYTGEDVTLFAMQIGSEGSNIARCTVSYNDSVYVFVVFGDGLSSNDEGPTGVGHLMGLSVKMNETADDIESINHVLNTENSTGVGIFYIEAYPNFSFDKEPDAIIPSTGTLTISRTNGLWDIIMKCKTDDGKLVNLTYTGEANDTPIGS